MAHGNFRKAIIIDGTGVEPTPDAEKMVLFNSDGTLVPFESRVFEARNFVIPAGTNTMQEGFMDLGRISLPDPFRWFLAVYMIEFEEEVAQGNPPLVDINIDTTEPGAPVGPESIGLSHAGASGFSGNRKWALSAQEDSIPENTFGWLDEPTPVDVVPYVYLNREPSVDIPVKRVRCALRLQ